MVKSMCTQFSNSQVTEKTPIVFLHGWGMNKQIWQPVLAQLPDNLAQRAIALDLPGYGDNNAYKGGYELEDLADWLAQELKNKQPAIIIGWSLGGLVGQMFATKYPDKIQQLNIVGSTPKFMASENWLGIKPEVLAMFAEQLVQDHKLTIERFLAIQAMGSRSARDDIKHLRKLVTSAAEPNLNALAKGLKILEKEDLRASWPKLEIQTFALFGKLDSLVPYKAIKAMQELKLDLNVEILPKASHAPFISHPSDFMDWLTKSLN